MKNLYGINCQKCLPFSIVVGIQNHLGIALGRNHTLLHALCRQIKQQENIKYITPMAIHLGYKTVLILSEQTNHKYSANTSSLALFHINRILYAKCTVRIVHILKFWPQGSQKVYLILAVLVISERSPGDCSETRMITL